MIKYEKRYSFTGEFDETGRWARIAYVNDLQIGWIHKLKHENSVRFLVNCQFPTRTRTDVPRESDVFDTYKDAQIYLKEKWELFLSITKSYAR